MSTKETGMTKKERRNRNYYVNELRNAARSLESAAGALSAIRVETERTIAEETGGCPSIAAKRHGLVEEAKELLGIARAFAATDPELEAAWAGSLDLER